MILVCTHGPPYGILDLVQRSDGSEEQTGCEQLLQKILEVKPRAHIFGHIHEEYGVFERDGVDFLNVSTMNQSYHIANLPMIYELA